MFVIYTYHFYVDKRSLERPGFHRKAPLRNVQKPELKCMAIHERGKNKHDKQSINVRNIHSKSRYHSAGSQVLAGDGNVLCVPVTSENRNYHTS